MRVVYQKPGLIQHVLTRSLPRSFSFEFCSSLNFLFLLELKSRVKSWLAFFIAVIFDNGSDVKNRVLHRDTLEFHLLEFCYFLSSSFSCLLNSTVLIRAERGWAGKRAVRSCSMCDAGVWPGYKGALILRTAQFKS